MDLQTSNEFLDKLMWTSNEFFTVMNCVYDQIPIELLKIHNSSAVDLGIIFLASILGTIIYWCTTPNFDSKFDIQTKVVAVVHFTTS